MSESTANGIHMTVPRRILDACTHARAAEYLLKSGWADTGEVQHGACIPWRRYVRRGTWVYLPETDEAPDWRRRMLEILEDLSNAECRSQAEVALEIAGMTWEEACEHEG